MRPIITIALLAFFSLLAACKTTAPLDAYQGLNDKQIFDRAEQNLQKNRYEQAIKDFEALDTLYPFGEYSQQGQLDIITAYHKNDDSDAALAAADRYIRLYPRANNVDYAYYLKGVINAGPKEAWYVKWINAESQKRDVSAKEDALEDFNTLIERFPNSKYAPEARRTVIEIRDLLARHELEIAQYYLTRKAYIAAVNRATVIVEEYDDTPQVPAALDIMIQSYRALNETPMANNTLRLLNNQYPNSKEIRKYK